MHIVLRNSKATFPGCEQINTIEEHNAISLEKGEVSFGRVGRPPATSKIEQLKERIKQGQASFYLVSRKGEHVSMWKAPLFDVFENRCPDDSTIPEYYRSYKRQINLWFKIGTITPIEDSEKYELFLMSNNRPIVQVVQECRTSFFFVKKLKSKI